MGFWQGALEGMVVQMQQNFWQGKRILLTGHTGFKGGWLALWLKQMGADVTGISLPPSTFPNLFELANVKAGIRNHFCDVRDAESLSSVIRAARPEVLFHMAAQPLVRASYREPIETFATNVMGTANVLEALRGQIDIRVAVMVTTDKVYRNMEHVYPYREHDSLGGHDPYSASKAASEIVITSYRESYLAKQGLAVASARAGNVIGGGDWSADRLIPDAVRAWSDHRTLLIRSPLAIRPWQHVLEPLAGYLALAQNLWENPELAGAYNFGPRTDTAATVQQVVEMARTAFGFGEVVYAQDRDEAHEASLLALEISKAKAILGFSPKMELSQAVYRTINWYKSIQQGMDARVLCEAEIAEYQELA
jgi:CDP-glucose 4,6-dehydratase